ncbi:MAG: ABC transporter ATP-binding protein [Acidobacteriia bacterium]|nr:ABC transporter ATP-binding protein [Terriglobia bacterium]
MNRVVIHAEQLSKRYRIGQIERPLQLREVLTRALRSPLALLRPVPRETFWALKDVSLEVREGEVLGLIGRNGSGKTTLLKILSRITRPTAGRAEIRGHVGSLLEVGTGFHPDLTGRENTYLSGAILGMRKQEIARKFDEIVAFAELEKFIDTPVKHYSSGMYVRLAFAVAAHLEPEILLVDEVLAVGDIKFQKKCLGKMGDVARAGRTVVLVSHQLNQIRRLCHRSLWLDDGSLRRDGSTAEVVSAYESAMTAPDVPASHGEAAGRIGPASSRTVRIVRWEIAEPVASDASPHTLATLGPVTIRLVLDAPAPLRHGQLELFLYNAEHVLLWSRQISGLHLDSGRHSLLLRFPFLPLRPGSYDWSATLWDDEFRSDRWDSFPSMLVATESLQHPLDELSGPLNLPCEFSVSPTPLIAASLRGNELF